MKDFIEKETPYGMVFVERSTPNLEEPLVDFGSKYLEAMAEFEIWEDRRRNLELLRDVQINYDGYKITITKNRIPWFDLSN